ncbi:MAG: hypothetical protein ACE5R6_08705 [Candidatus Heimdallarchaeota archaeon]
MANLADPIKIADMQVKNRFVMPPMVTNFASDKGEVTDRLLRYYEQRSEGGIGLIIVEATAIAWEHRLQKYSVGIYDDRLIPRLTQLADRIKAHGARAFIQLVHAGSKSRVAERLVGPSAIRVLDGPLPEELSKEEIATIKEMFVDAAQRAYAAGFDGIELHGAHMYLLSSFLSSYTNQREDEYGGSTPNKAKLAVDIIKAIRNELGSYPMLCRINSIENIIRGIEIEESKQIAQILEHAGVDALHVSGVDAPYFNPKQLAKFSTETKPELLKSYPDGCYIPCAAVIKEVVKIPVIGVGMVRDAAFTEKIIQEGLCDLLSIGRGLIADPLFAQKTLNGRGETIIQCEDCDQCFRQLAELKPITCSVNPDL